MLPNLIFMLWLEGSRPRFKGQFSILKSREPSLSFAMNFHCLNNRGLVMYEGNLLQSSNFTKVYHCIQSAESYDVLTVKIQHYFYLSKGCTPHLGIAHRTQQPPLTAFLVKAMSMRYPWQRVVVIIFRDHLTMQYLEDKGESFESC